MLGRYTEEDKRDSFMAGYRLGEIAANKIRWERHRARVDELLASNNALRDRALKAEAALALLDHAFCDRHGCFPLERFTESGRLYHAAMSLAREITGDDYGRRTANAKRALAEFNSRSEDARAA